MIVKLIPLTLVPFLQLARLDSAQAFKPVDRQNDREQITNNISNYLSESPKARYSAIAVNKKKRLIGWSLDHESERSAKAGAILACPNSCYEEIEIFEPYPRGFFSLATGDYIEGHTKKAWGIGSGFNIPVSETRALSDCRLQSCRIRVIFGSHGGEIYGDSPRFELGKRSGYIEF